MRKASKMSRHRTLWAILFVTGAVLLLATVHGLSQGIASGMSSCRFASLDKRQDERELAQALGDQYIEWGETNNFTADQNEDIERYVDRQIALLGSSSSKEREEAGRQIQCLWRLCAPKLVASLGHHDAAVNEAVMKSLIAMRSGTIVEEIIKTVKSSSDPRVRYTGVFALGMMNEISVTRVNNRRVMDERTSRDLADARIRPFLALLEQNEEDPVMLQIVRNAFVYLDKPIDKRPKKVD